MSIDEILEFELQGLINTINEYTRENYIRNYTKILNSLNYPQDKDRYVKTISRLLDWYEYNIKEIRKNELLYNKHEHEKTIKILKQLLQQLEH